MANFKRTRSFEDAIRRGKLRWVKGILAPGIKEARKSVSAMLPTSNALIRKKTSLANSFVLGEITSQELRKHKGLFSKKELKNLETTKRRHIEASFERAMQDLTNQELPRPKRCMAVAYLSKARVEKAIPYMIEYLKSTIDNPYAETAVPVQITCLRALGRFPRSIEAFEAVKSFALAEGLQTWKWFTLEKRRIVSFEAVLQLAKFGKKGLPVLWQVLERKNQDPLTIAPIRSLRKLMSRSPRLVRNERLRKLLERLARQGKTRFIRLRAIFALEQICLATLDEKLDSTMRAIVSSDRSSHVKEWIRYFSESVARRAKKGEFELEQETTYLQPKDELPF